MRAADYIESLNRLAAGLIGAEAAVAHIIARYESDPDIVGDPRRERAFYQSAFDGVNWRWPWFDRWRHHFEMLGSVPRMWEWDGKPPDRVFLLAHSVAMGWRRDGYARHGLCLFFAPPSDEPEPIREIIAAKIAAYASGEGPIAFPPFFPGDRTSVLPSIKPRKPYGRGTTLCAFRGFE
jgi:hypothetical protein